MHASHTGPEALSRHLRRRHEYTGCASWEEQQNCRSKRDPVKDLGNETLQAAREQHKESLKRLVDNVWEDYQRIKARENAELERMETSNRVIQSADYQRSRSTPCRTRSPTTTATPQRGSSLSYNQRSPGNDQGMTGYQGLSGLNNRYQQVRKKHESERRPARTAPTRDDYNEMTQRRNIDAIVNPRADNQRLNSQIRQQGMVPRDCQCRSDTDISMEGDAGFEDLRDFEKYVEAEANRLDAVLKDVENDLYMISKRKERKKPCLAPITRETYRSMQQSICPAVEPSRSRQPAPQNMESRRSRQPVPRCMEPKKLKKPPPDYPETSRSQKPAPRRCQCPSKKQSSQRTTWEVEQSDSVMELHPFKARTASGRQWTDVESKSTVQFLQIEDSTTEDSSSSEISVPNTEDLEVVEQMLMELESNLKSQNCPGPCSADISLKNVSPPKNIKQIKQMVSAEDRDVGLALRLARKIPPNKAELSGRCPKFKTSSEVIDPYGDVEEMTPELAARIMQADERGISAVSPPHKMFACLFPEHAVEPFYEVGSVTTKNGLVVPLQGSEYTSLFSPQDIIEMSMMSDCIRPDIVPSNPSTSIANNESRLAERGSLVDSADITGWTSLAESANLPGTLSTFEEGGGGALVYTLRPQELATNIRLRGSVKPTWFPGYYMVLPTDSKIKLATSASQVLTAAHVEVSPDIFNLKKKRVCQC